MKATKIFVDETGNFGEGFLGLGIYEPAAGLSPSTLLHDLQARPTSAALVKEALETRGYLHAVEDSWELKIEVMDGIRRACPGVFEFVWVDREGEREAKRAGFNRDSLLNLMLALPCIQMSPALIEVESRPTADEQAVKSIRTENVSLLREAIAPLLNNVLAQAVAGNWRPDALEIRARTKAQQTTGLQVVDYLSWMRRRQHLGKNDDPVKLSEVARLEPMPQLPPEWLHYERYRMGPA